MTIEAMDISLSYASVARFRVVKNSSVKLICKDIFGVRLAIAADKFSVDLSAGWDIV